MLHSILTILCVFLAGFTFNEMFVSKFQKKSSTLEFEFFGLVGARITSFTLRVDRSLNFIMIEELAIVILIQGKTCLLFIQL